MKIITPQMKKSNHTIKQLKFKNMKLALIVTLTNFIMLTSCSKDWSCPAEKGFSCMSISQVDGDDQLSKNMDHTDIKKNGNVSKTLFTNTITDIQTDELESVRTQEVIGKILLTPYIDKEGNLHSGKYIHTVDEKPEWRIVNNGN